MNEYHKIEQEINGLDLNIDTENDLHLLIKQHRDQYLNWKQFTADTVSNVYLDQNVCYEMLQSMKDQLNNNKYYSSSTYNFHDLYHFSF